MSGKSIADAIFIVRKLQEKMLIAIARCLIVFWTLVQPDMMPRDIL